MSCSYWAGLLGTAKSLHELSADNTWKVRQRVTDEGGAAEGKTNFPREEWKWNLHS